MFEIWLGASTKEQKNENILKCFLQKVSEDTVDEKLLSTLEKKAYFFCRDVEKRWQKCYRKIDVFQKKHNIFLSNTTKIEILDFTPKPSISKAGRKRKSFEEKSERSKRRQASEVSKAAMDDTELLVRAACSSANKNSNFTLSRALKTTLESPEKILKLSTLEKTNANSLSPDEALAFLLENNFSKAQYCNIQSENKSRNCNIYPPYKSLTAVKSKCRPEGIEVLENMARVPLESLLQHTVSRLIKFQMDVLMAVLNKTESNSIDAELVVSYGFDSSTGQSNYKQQYFQESENYSDSSLLATTLIPLQLIDSDKNILWQNRTPQSIRFCRPIKLEFIKETKETILKERAEIEEQIKKLETFQVQINEKSCINVKFKLFLTIIDGKVLNVLTETPSYQTCPICGATPNDFLSTHDLTSEKFKPKEDHLRYGISPLHCCLRSFEFFVHLGYKKMVKKWQIRNPKDKKIVEKSKERIQKEFWEKLGLRVDKPKTGGCGSSNDGNTARRAFDEYEVFAEILGADKDIIFRFKVILTTLSCQLPVDVEKFQKYCFDTAHRYMQKYPWLPMTPTVHKILVHSRQIMENSVLPLGFFGEDAAECRHKVYKTDRLNHSRKNSRLNNLTDVFHRALDSSDPFISSIYLTKRIKCHKKADLPREVIEMLSCTDLSNENDNNNDHESYNDDSDSSES